MKVHVQLFVTCLVDSFFPRVGEAVLQVLNRAGVGVEFPPGQTCCGQPAFNAGYQPQAISMARHTIEALENAPGPVLVPSGSCAAMIVHGYLELFKDDPAWRPCAQALAARTYEFSQFLVDELGITDVGIPRAGKLAYHPACHLLRDLGVDHQPLALLQSATVAKVQTLGQECCGFGGLFALDHAPVSTEMMNRKMDQIAESQAETVVACDVSCLMHLEGGLRKKGSEVRCAHLAQILAGQDGGLQ